MGVAMLEPSLPLWMLDKMDAPKWQQGTSLSLIICLNSLAKLATACISE